MACFIICTVYEWYYINCCWISQPPIKLPNFETFMFMWLVESFCELNENKSVLPSHTKNEKELILNKNRTEPHLDSTWCCCTQNSILLFRKCGPLLGAILICRLPRSRRPISERVSACSVQSAGQRSSLKCEVCK